MYILISQSLINGILAGMIYALIASGFTLLYGNAGVLFFAIGEVFMLGAVLLYCLIEGMSISYFLGVVIVMALLGTFGMFLERAIFRRLTGNDLTFAIGSLALGMLITGIVLKTFGERGKGLITPFPGSFKITGLVIAYDKLIVVGVGLVVIVALHLFFSFTKTGRAIRAVAQDVEAAQLMGVEVFRVKSLTFFLALAVAGLAGALVAPLYYVDAFMGTPVLMTALIVVVLGGLGSFPGAVIGGLVIGVLENIGQTFLGGTTTLLLFMIVIVMLILRPEGLFANE